MAHLDSKPPDWFKPDPNQPRKTFVEADLRLLGESLKVHQNEPLQAMPDGLLIDGERRLRAAKLVGLEKLDVIITDLKLSQVQVATIRLATFFHRADLSVYEKWQACKQLMEMNGWPGVELARHLHLDPSTVTRLLSPSKCIPEAQEALRDGKIGISDAYALSKLPPEDQPGLLAMKLGGASRDALERQGRNKRAAGNPVVRASKIRVPLVSGATVTVAGDECSLEEAIEHASEAIKLMKQAVSKGLNAKTAMNVWKDVAAAG